MRVAVVEEAANRRRARGARFGTSNGSTVTGAAIAAEPGATTSLAAADSCSAARFARICEGLLDPSPSRGRYGSREIGCQCEDSARAGRAVLRDVTLPAPLRRDARLI